LLLQFRVISKKKIGLTVKDLTRKLLILVELNDPSRESRMHTHYSIQSHDWVGSQHEVLRVALLALIWIVEHVFLVESHLSVLCDIFRLEC